MAQAWRVASGITTFILLSACTAQSQQYSAEFLAMGTTVSITVADESPSRAQHATVAAQTEIQRLGREWYAWRNDGELAQLNAALATGHPYSPSSELIDVLKLSAQTFRASDGAFDPALGRLVKLWGFNNAERPATQPLPTDAQIQAWRSDHPTFADLAITGTTVASSRTDLIIDLGAIGKGYAVDRAVALLRRDGIQHAMVNAGGNLRAIGTNGNLPWRIAIHDPRENNALFMLELGLDESVSTSGDDQRFIIDGIHRWHHLLDPRTGYPAEHTIAVTVLATDATIADAASTAIFIAGPDAWRSVANKLGIHFVLRIDAKGGMQVSRELLPRLRPIKREAGPLAIETVDL